MPASHPYTYWVYLLASQPNGTLYVGVTSNLRRRIWQHRTGAIEGFTKQYRIHQLVWLEEHRNVARAIAREKEIKGWLRKRKIQLIVSANPRWIDLSADWYERPMDSSLRSE